jgi:membrane-associated HD superfamily phosphohydrolase
MKINYKSMALLSFMFFGIMVVTTTNITAQKREEKPNAKLAKKAKITLEKAREIALKQDSGTVESEELEKEKGKLVYSFDIRNAKGTITEIWVDAKNGNIVHKSEEDAAAEAKEKAADMKKKSKN